MDEKFFASSLLENNGPKHAQVEFEGNFFTKKSSKNFKTTPHKIAQYFQHSAPLGKFMLPFANTR